MEVLETSAGDATSPSCSDGLAWLPCSPLAAAYPDDIDSACSTPYYSAPSSPGRSHPGYYFSAPASPIHYMLTSSSASSYNNSSAVSDGAEGSFEFEFSPRFSGLPSAGSAAAGSMISADELFLNGQIRPMRLVSHLQRAQALAPLVDLEEEEVEEDEGGVRGARKEGECGEPGGARRREMGLRSISVHRRARSMSPLRSAPAFGWQDEQEEEGSDRCGARGEVSGSAQGTDVKRDEGEEEEATATPSSSASASRSSSSSSSSSASSGRNSKRWVFLKDFLYRSKSEGRASGMEKFWHNISFSPAKEKTSALLFFSNKAAKSKEAVRAADTDSTGPPASGCTPESSTEPKKKVKKQSGSATPDPCIPTTSTSADTNNESKKSTTTPPNRPVNGVVKKRRKPAPSPHERHYAAKRAQAEELRRKTFLPYRQGLLGCLGFSSRGYYAMNGLARTLNTVTSR